MSLRPFSTLALGLTLTLAGASESFAKPTPFILGEDRFEIEVPASWQSPKDFYGFPLSLIGPETPEGRRTVIGITPAGAADEEKVFDQGDKALKSYMAGREAWLEQYDGKSISFDPYRKTSWPGIEEAHTLGYHYELPTGTFYERSLFILCNGRRLLHIKTLVTAQREKTDQKIVDDTLRTLKCTSSATSGGKKK